MARPPIMQDFLTAMATAAAASGNAGFTLRQVTPFYPVWLEQMLSAGAYNVARPTGQQNVGVQLSQAAKKLVDTGRLVKNLQEGSMVRPAYTTIIGGREVTVSETTQPVVEYLYSLP